MSDDLKLKRKLTQYSNCSPDAIAQGSSAQMMYFVADAKHDIAILSARIEAQEAEIARLKSDRMESIDYICDLQRIIEDICHKRTIRTPKTVARFHFDKAVEYQSRANQAESALAKAVEVMRAVGHVGVDFGYGEYVLEDRFIEAARDFVKEHDKP